MVQDWPSLISAICAVVGGIICSLVTLRHTNKPADRAMQMPSAPPRLGFEFDSGLWQLHPEQLVWATCHDCGLDDEGVQLDHVALCLWCAELVLLNKYLGLNAPVYRYYKVG